MRFFSRGKLLISGEYLVLKGADALAVPLKKGQDLQVSRSDNTQTLSWESREKDIVWFTATFNKPFFEIENTSDEAIAATLVRHFQAMVELNPRFQESAFGNKVVTDLEFNREWGFGSSSTLVSNLAWWAEIDPFALHKGLSPGSGYDVVCAREDGPVYFRLMKQGYETEPVDLKNSVTRYLYFVYLGRKERSSAHVDKFLSKKRAYRSERRMVSELSRHMACSGTIEDMAYYMKEHEQLISSVLRMPTLKERLFSDLSGEAKSLGAWGGDFAMITWTGTRKNLEGYLKAKNLKTYFSFKDLVKTR